MSEDFLNVYEDHVVHVYGYFSFRALARADAEDLTQLTFEKALRAWGSYQPERASPRTWLLAIARNAYIDFRRREPRVRQLSISSGQIGEEALPRLPGPEQNLGLPPDLEAAVRRLGRREREVLALRFGADMRGPEIAELLKLSVANVQQLLSRALRRLRRDLETEASAAPPAGE